MTELRTPSVSDWPVFLDLASREGWRIPSVEQQFFREQRPADAFVLRKDGEACGFVTAICHQRSGWVGNLLVHQGLRGRGLGTHLFRHALQVLRLRGTQTVWLTASAQGRPLYEKEGFRVVDGTVRWVRNRRGEFDAVPPGDEVECFLAADRSVWGESRTVMLRGLMAGGNVFFEGGSCALLQAGKDFRVLGPWISAELCPRENRRLLSAVLDAAPGGEIVADVLESSPLAPLLAAAGFERTGRCDLMVNGPLENIALSRLVALASLGSMG